MNSKEITITRIINEKRYIKIVENIYKTKTSVPHKLFTVAIYVFQTKTSFLTMNKKLSFLKNAIIAFY